MQTSTLYTPLNQKQFEPHMLAEPKLFFNHAIQGDLFLLREREREGRMENVKKKKKKRREAEFEC